MVAAATCGQSRGAMPRPRKVKTRAVLATHLKFLGVTTATLKLYRSAVQEFFKWRRQQGLPRCISFLELDGQLAEFINALYVSGDPLYKAANVLSGMKRLLPQARKLLEISGLYYKSWVRVTPRKRALPIKAEWVKAFGSYALAQKRPLFGLLAVFGFLGLFRASELCSLTFPQLRFVSGSV